MVCDLAALAVEKIVGSRWVGGPPPFICGASIDSRTIGAGELFVAIKTDRDDGHRYIAQAAALGAAAAIVERVDHSVHLPQLPVGNSILALQAIAAANRRAAACEITAIAGSYGKTTTKDLLALLLGENCTCATAGNLNNGFGVALSLLRLDSNRHRYGVFEVGIGAPGEMAPIVNMLSPKNVIFTGLSTKHREFFRSDNALIIEKLSIGRDVRVRGGIVVAPRRLLAMEQFSPLMAVAIGPSPRAANFTLPDSSSGFFEDFSLCLAICEHFSIANETIVKRLRSWTPSPLRGATYAHKFAKRHYYVDCYNSDLRPLLNSAEAFAKKFSSAPRLFAIGAMEELGPESDSIHREAGAKLPLSAGDKFFFIGARCSHIAAGLIGRGLPPERAKLFQTLGQMKSEMESFEGAVFIKGSRAYAMERLVDFANCEKV
ncbi:MAG: Mur ligase domain-containing protein [Puniceicoccales bacterium]|nr:Mur ligase domain-containing protein [Puniceicoccales bacterium]